MPVKFGDPRLPLRFWVNVQRSKNGCWHWTKRLDPKTGYGYYWVGRKVDEQPAASPAHRWAYHVLVRELIPRGQPGHLQVDHECHNRSKSCKGGPACLHRRCVNPAHLAARKPVENTQASRHAPASKNRVKTHCIRGHALAGDNLMIDRRGRRNCYTCKIAVGAETRRKRLARERGEDWIRTNRNAEKSHCKWGHPLSGDNLRIGTTGQRVCRRCQANAVAASRERKRHGNGGVRPSKTMTHCKRGHPLSGDNVYLYGPDKQYRGCRECRGEARRQYRARGGKH